MATTSQIIAYLRCCYQADNRETGIGNLLQKKHRHVCFFTGEEVIVRGLLPRIPVDPSVADGAKKESLLYRRDKTLIYATQFIVGRTKSRKQFCAPIVFFPSKFVDVQDVTCIEPDLASPILNYPAIGALAGSEESADLDALPALLPPLPWDRSAIHTVGGTMAELLPQVDFLPLAEFPRLASHDTVRRKSSDGTLICLPASAMALIPNSPNTRGVLFELSELAQAERYSAALKAVLEPDAVNSRRADVARRPWVPAMLSAAQQRVLASARANPLTFVNGPPGTGKSYTIAAIALDHLSRGESVLVASRMDQAVNVVAGKLQSLVGSAEAIVRAGRSEHLRDLKRRLDLLLSGTRRNNEPEVSARALRKKLGQLDRNIDRLERLLSTHLQREIAWGALREQPPVSLVEHLTAGLRRRLLDWQLDRFQPVADRMEEYHRRLTDRMQLARRLLQVTLDERVQRLLRRKRGELNTFLKAIRTRSDTNQQRLFAEVDFETLLHAFPVWLTKINDLSHVLPHQCELFDLAIVDEATQSDLATAMPFLQRAKRVAVVGDPKQLRHVSFLPEQRMIRCADEWQLSPLQLDRFHFRRVSVLDAVDQAIQRQDCVMFLNEHFRSLPQIISFSNEEFYGNALHVMRQNPETETRACVELRHVTGIRNKHGANPVEADALVKELRNQIQRDRALSGSACQSIGVLSPFRDQVDFLASRINGQLSQEDLLRHEVLVGTAHTFQGEERDVMLLSLAADRDSHPATLRFLSNPNVFNVSITRARHRQVVFSSLQPKDLPPDALLRRFLQFSQMQPTIAHEHKSNVDTFRGEVVTVLERNGLRTWPDYAVAGITLDLVAQSANDGNSVGIDLVGYPGQLAEAYSLERYRMIERAGLYVVPIAYRDWLASPEQCVRAILDRTAVAT